MTIREIQQFSEVRYQARAYLCYLFTRNMPSKLPNPNLEDIIKQLNKISQEVDDFDALYILDTDGNQIISNISKNEDYVIGKDVNRSSKAYFYRAVKEKRCVLTDPYPSSLTNNLCVTAGYPLYDDKGELKYVICIDVSLENILKIAQPSPITQIFEKFTKITYTLFSFALFIISSVMFYHGVESFVHAGINLTNINIEEMFKSTILLTLSLAIFDLVKTIFEEEVLGQSKKNSSIGLHKTMVRFLGSIIIALAIEALMLVFKFALTNPENILYAVYLVGGVTLLLIGLSVYLRFANTNKDSDDCSN
ncbi:MAG: PDC sensor domain-containing protein [Campylobacteraceae bacterium]